MIPHRHHDDLEEEAHHLEREVAEQTEVLEELVEELAPPATTPGPAVSVSIVATPLPLKEQA